MAERWLESETSLGREIFGPLGGIVELGTVAASGPKSLPEISVGEFVTSHRDELDRILAAVRDIGGFHPETMAIVDELGWHRNHEITVPSLLLWSGCIEAFSPHLEEPAAVRRMVRMGTDLQLANLMHALVGAASSKGRAAEPNSELIIETMGSAAALLGLDHERAVRDIFRMWRVAFLPNILMPSSKSPEVTKSNFREYAHILERMLGCNGNA
ncbi:hypothetical protein [Streptomyces sp. NPDC019890]|uniref:hypothetical protein n=1 Tax=Streptomyces sp. NPDC019890 TaxID=3365064 RepID=UPI003850ABE7